MSLPIDATCMLCYLKKYLDLTRTLGDDSKVNAFMREQAQQFLDLPPHLPSPALGPGSTELLRKHYGLEPDRFRAEKEASNAFVVARLEDLRRRVRGAKDPVLAALQFAILGNYLDFSALGKEVSFEKLDAMLDEALEMPLDPQMVAQFKGELEKGKKLLYLTDNAGEIGFDRICAETLREQYPHLEITFCVRGGPAMNDATREDAAVVGIDFPIIDNGSCIAGIIPEMLGDEAKQALETADVILSKGMANTECLYGSGYNIYFAFLVKCDKFVRIFKKPLMTPMLIQDPNVSKKGTP